MPVEKISITHSPVLTGQRRFRLNLVPSPSQEEAMAPAGTFTGYRHKIRAAGGYWEASWVYHDELPMLTETFEFGWTREARMQGSRGLQVFEGFINGMELNLQGELPSLKMVSYGYVRTLFWRVWNQTVVTTDVNLSDEIYNILTGVGQFIASVSRETNLTQINRKHDADRWAGDICFSLCDAGDIAYNRYFLGVYDNRQAVYEQIAKYAVL